MSQEHVQKMLAQKAIREGMMTLGGSGNDSSLGLTGMCGQIEAFLAQAKNAPAPQCIEVSGDNKKKGGREEGNGGNNESGGDDREIHLNLILGVFEEKKAAMAAAASRMKEAGDVDTANSNKQAADKSLLAVEMGGGSLGARKGNILLPSQQAEELLYAEKMRDSQAVLSMFGALADTRGPIGISDADSRRREKMKRGLGAKGRRNNNNDDEGDDADEVTDSSDDEVVIMDYDEDMSSSDDEDKADTSRAKALLFGQKKPLIEEI